MSPTAPPSGLTVLLNDTRECGEPSLFLIDLDQLPGPLRQGFERRVQRAGVYEVYVRSGEEQYFVDGLVDLPAEDEGGRCDWTLEFKSWMDWNAARRNLYQQRLTQIPAPPPPSVIIHWN
jgi:hypothetical protein